jgi:glyoxylase-like metal-dependent hydrolase (beta-lactamase superfamily II)
LPGRQAWVSILGQKKGIGVSVPCESLTLGRRVDMVDSAEEVMNTQDHTSVKSVFALNYAVSTLSSYAAFYLGPRFFPDAKEHVSFMYYYLIKTDKQNILVDVGTTPEVAAERNFSNYIPPDVMLGKFGLKPSDIETIIITHAHFDHVDALGLFQNAKIYMQRACYRFMVEEGIDYAFFRGTPGYPHRKSSFEVLTRMWNGQMKLIDGDAEIFPNIKVIKIGGHTPGLQIVVIETKGKPIVLGSDAINLYAILEKDHPNGMVTGDLRDVVKGFETVRRLNGIVVSGHDPKVMSLFKPFEKGIVQVFP